MKLRLAFITLAYGVALTVGALVVSGRLGVSLFRQELQQVQALESDGGGPSVLLCGFNCTGTVIVFTSFNNDFNPCAWHVYGVPCHVPGYHVQINGLVTYPVFVQPVFVQPACLNCGIAFPSPVCWQCGGFTWWPNWSACHFNCNGRW